MRKNSPRKWLHAVLDLLPVLLIPVFMIYSHRHTLTERTEVEINYKYQSNEVNTLDDLVEGNIYLCNKFNFVLSDIEETLEITIYSYDDTSNVVWYNYQGLDEVASDSEYHNINGNEVFLSIDNGEMYVYFTNSDLYASVIYNSFDYQFINLVFSVNNNLEYFKDYLNSSSSDMPTYTDYNVIESVSVNDTNKDIMTVFMDDFNGAIDNYFNMGNVFNLNGVYQWFNTNIFNGNAPTVIYSVWNIALYELVMDLLFLLYGLFMWFIDMIQKLMEKPLDSVK